MAEPGLYPIRSQDPVGMMPAMMPEVTPAPPQNPGTLVQKEDSDLAKQRKRDLLTYAQNFYRASWNWRNANKHEKWNKWDRNYHSIYDPTKKARKEQWQTIMFIGITVQTVEIICSQIFKTMMAPKPPIQVTSGPAGDDLQAELIQDVIDYELRKSHFDVNFYDALKECVRYGSGFMKFYWERVIDTRPRKVPVMQSADQVIQGASPEALAGNAPMPKPMITGYEIKDQKVLLKNQLSAKYIHIRDLFPEPNTKDWKHVIHREKIPYDTIVRHIKDGSFFDCRNELDYLIEGDKFDEDIRQSKYDRGYFEQNRDKAKFEKKHTVWELYADIPRKWIDFEIPDGDDAEELVPAKVMVASGTALLASERNSFFDGECPILKMDYIRTGEPYGKGIIELIEDEQDEINELRNLRVDNINLIINKMIAIIEAALVNANDLVSKPGGIIRLKQNVGLDDIRKAILPIDMGDVTSSAYKETFEIERQVQERTGANRVTLGTSNEVRDTNQTLGGMELLRQTFNERLAAYGMVIESTFLLSAAEKIYSLIYQELTPPDLMHILGDHPVEIEEPPAPGITPTKVPRFMAFAFVPPEIVNQNYMFRPMGIFSLENKIVKAAQVMDLMKVFAGNPSFDIISAGKYVATKLQGIDEAAKWFHPLPLGLPGMMPGLPGAPLGTPPPGGAPPLPSGPGGPLPGVNNAPGLKGGPNGNQPNFLPPNPLRRMPVIG